MNRNSMKFITKKYFWIGDPIQIPYLTEILQTEREISVNVEYQTRWSYLGYICLLQIGTRSRDYLIDVINLKNDLEDLNVTFKNCKIIKILNGGKKSITRLKNDLGLNLINVFDANEAISLLKWSNSSFKNLILSFYQINVSENLAHVDWSMRPLTLEMIKDLRLKVHHVFFEYDKLRNLLFENGKNSLNTVLNRSKAFCSTTFNRSVIDFGILLRANLNHNERQTLTFQLLIILKDKICLHHDKMNLLNSCHELSMLEYPHEIKDFPFYFIFGDNISSKQKEIIFLIVTICIRRNNIALVYKYFFLVRNCLLYPKKMSKYRGYSEGYGFLIKRKYFSKSRVRMYQFINNKLKLFSKKEIQQKAFQCIKIPFDYWFINFIKNYKKKNYLKLPYNLETNVDFLTLKKYYKKVLNYNSKQKESARNLLKNK